MSRIAGEVITPEEFNQVWQIMREGRHAEALQSWNDFIDHSGALGAHRFKMARGIALLLTGDPQGALADFLDLRRPMGPVRISQPLVGASLWLQGKPEAACEDWAYEISCRRSREITHGDAARGILVPALLWWASIDPDRSQWRKLAVEELRRRWRTKTHQQFDWPGPVASHLLGISAIEALPTVTSGHPTLQARYRCQAHFYLGARALDRGDLSVYREQLALAVAQGADSFVVAEYHLARAELRRLS